MNLFVSQLTHGLYLCFIVGKTTIVDQMKHIYAYAFCTKCESICACSKQKKNKNVSAFLLQYFESELNWTEQFDRHEMIVVSTLNAI